METHLDAYRYAATACSVAPAKMGLVAVHPWDIDGARRVRLTSIWIDRKQAPDPSTFLPPNLRVAHLEALTDTLAAAAS